MIGDAASFSYPSRADLEAVHDRIDREATACQGAHQELAAQVDSDLDSLRAGVATRLAKISNGMLRPMIGMAVTSALSLVISVVALVMAHG